MRGLGDNIYQRAFLKRFKECEAVYLETPWPQLYEDMPWVKPVRSNTDLRTQKKNVNHIPDSIWHKTDMRAAKTISYGGSPIIAGMTAAFGVSPDTFDLPPLKHYIPPYHAGIDTREYALIRPVTIRSEWRADSRNCMPQYIAECSEVLYNHNLTIIRVADIASGSEWAVEPLPYADLAFDHGELSVMQLLALVAHARVVVGPIGWIVPACIASKTPAWIICGGQGGYNAPSRICPRTATWVEFAIPDNFCGCRLKMHECDKRITGHVERFANMVSRIGIRPAFSAAN